MTVSEAHACTGLEARARQSLGASSAAVHAMVVRAVERHDIHGVRAIDVGCGQGSLRAALGGRFATYCGVDAVAYAGFPADAEFVRVDLDAAAWPDTIGTAALVAAVETIEHLENPWAFARHLADLAEPGGWIVVTTPNQLSALSLLTLITKRRFSAFQDVHYPAHRTALLESDVARACHASGLDVVECAYSLQGRIPFTGWHYPTRVSRIWPRLLSDNLIVVARKRRG